MPVRLVDLDKPLESVVLPSTGREVRVVPMNGAVAQLKAELERTDDPAVLWQIAAELLPDADPGEIAKLTMPHVLAVIRIASGRADELLAEIEAEREKEREGNPEAPASSKPEVARHGTGSAS